MATEQQVLPLSYQQREVFRRAGRALLTLLREVVKSEVKQADGLAEDLDLAPSHLSAALQGAGKHFSIEWLPAVLAADRDDRILRHLAKLKGMTVVPRVELTEAQKFEIYQRAVEAESPRIAAAARRRLYGQEDES